MILREKELKERLLEGVNLIGDIVGSTLGPKGKLVLIDDNGNPYITKDGVTVARSMSHEDFAINSAIELIKQVAEKTVKDAGDNTSTACILAQSLINNGFNKIGRVGNKIDFLKGFDFASNIVKENIQKLSKPITTIEEAENVALISSNGDKEISSLIGDALRQVGLKGNIHVIKNGAGKTFLDITKGFKFAKGIAAQQLLNKEGKCVIDNAYIVVYNGDLMHFNPVKSVLQDIFEEYGNVNVVLIAHTFGGSVLDNCLLNRQQGVLNIYPVEAPSFGVNRGEILEDICVLTSEITELPSTITEPITGFAGKVLITRDFTTIFDGFNCKENLDYRINKIENQIQECNDIIELQVLKERVSNLRQNVATLYIGGLTDADTNERADRIDDAVCAVRSAIEEGIVVGGGNTYIQCALKLKEEEPDNNNSYLEGYSVIIDALYEPFKRLCENSDYPSINTISSAYDYGIDFSTNMNVNLLDKGIIDSAKACRVAFENAVAVAKVFLNINSFIKI